MDAHNIAPTTYRDILRSYGRNVADRLADTDLTPRQARLTRVLVNLASNDSRAACVYPPTDQTRDDVVRTHAGTMWDARAIVQAIGPAADHDLDVASDRAIAIIRNV